MRELEKLEDVNDELRGESSCEHIATEGEPVIMLSAHIDKKSSLSCCSRRQFSISFVYRTGVSDRHDSKKTVR